MISLFPIIMIIRLLNAKFTICTVKKKRTIVFKNTLTKSKEFSHTPHSNKQVFKSITRIQLITFGYRDFDVHKIDMQCGICNDDPQKICFFNFSKWAIKSDKNTDSWLNMLIDFFFFSCYKKLSLSLFCFLEKKKCFTSIVFCPYNLLSQKEKCKLIDTRDETLRRKSSGGITDGLNWLKRHHNFSFFFFSSSNFSFT